MGKKEQQNVLANLPSVDSLLRGPQGADWLSSFPREVVLTAIREVLDKVRREVLEGRRKEADLHSLVSAIGEKVEKLSSFSLVPVINATGVVLHTNLGRALLSEKAVENIRRVCGGYSNLEYDLEAGARGKRHVHAKGILRLITGAEEAFVVNNNAAAVLLSLNTLAKGKEVIVSRGELVEIGGSFRVPDVMAASGAVLREVGTTNKTHLHDYERAINEDTALILKVHQSNYTITGFSADVAIEDLMSLGRRQGIPVMFDLGSGCLIDLRQYGILSEPPVQEIVKAGVDVVTFSGDKLLGGPQGGIIAGRKELIDRIQKNPIARAVRVDKMTIAAFEATLMSYMDRDRAVEEIPTLRMLFQPLERIRARARRIAAALRRRVKNARITVIEERSMAGGGSLPEKEFKSIAVSLVPDVMKVNELENRLRRGTPPVVARIKDDALIIDARTILDREVPLVAGAVASALSSGKVD